MDLYIFESAQITAYKIEAKELIFILILVYVY